MTMPVFDDPETGLELPVIAEEESPGREGAASARRRQKFVLGTTLLGLGLAAAVVGGLCGHGSGQCRRRKQNIVVAATTPLQQPTSLPLPVPSQVPSDLPSSQPSDVPSTIPSGVPTALPTAFPTSRPSTRPTTESLFTASSSLEEEAPAPAPAPGCQLVGCYLRNLGSGAEQLLDPTAPTSYSITTTTSRNGSTTTTTASSRYSIRCDYNTSADVIWADFFVPTIADQGPVSPSAAAPATTFALHHREHMAPFWMQSNSANWIEPVPYLSTCDDDAAADISLSVTQKTIRVAAANTENAKMYCLDMSFKLMAQCQEEKAEKLQVMTTTSSIAAPPSAVASSEEEVVEEAALVPMGTTDSCAMACYLHNIDTGVDLVMEETDTIAYAVAADGSSRYSIRCDPGQDDQTRIAYAKFFFNGQDRREFNAPFWMQSNSSGGSTTSDWIEAAPYLTTCDNHKDDETSSAKKTVRIALATNNDYGEEYYCRDVTFDLVAQCH